MTVIVCVDNRNGMMFNHRRQSRDRAVLDDIGKTLGSARLWIAPCSAALFKEMPQAAPHDDFLRYAPETDFCFVEDRDPAACADRIDRLILYHWNRDYPADVFFDPAPFAAFREAERTEFPGTSHEKITKEVLVR